MSSSNLRYQKIRKLGSGGMATVWLAKDSKLDRLVALKEIHQHLLSDTAIHQRFYLEAKSVASLSHKNIISIFDTEESPVPLIVMEYLEGQTLETLLKRHQTLPDLVTLEIARQLFTGLAHAHQNKLIHRDIKPSNLIITSNGRLKIADFGLAHIINQNTLTATGQFLGSTMYTSPEMVEGKELTGKSDVFSAGCVLYECLSGTSPFNGASPSEILNNVCTKKVDDLTQLNPKILPEISDLINRMLHKNGDSRLNSLEVLEILTSILNKHAVQLGKSRVQNYLNDSVLYQKQEEVELLTAITSQADIAKKAGKTADYYRWSHLKKIYDGGEMGKSDTTISKKKGKWVGLLAGISACLALGYFISLNGEIPKPKPVPELNSLDDRESLITLVDTTDQEHVDQQYQKNSDSAINVNTEQKETSISKPQTKTHPMVGFLQLKSRPPQARVYLNGKLKGTTPIEKAISLRPGQHKLVLLRNGCKPYSQKIRIEAADTLNLALTLDPLK